MSEFDPWNPSIEDMIDLNVPIYDQIERMADAASRCYKTAYMVDDRRQQNRIIQACRVLDYNWTWLHENMQKIEDGCGPNGPTGEFPGGQGASDRLYGDQWEKQATASKDEEQQNIDEILDAIAQNGGQATPALWARRRAVFDFRKRRYNPPVFNPDLPVPPPPPEEPDLGG